MAEELHLDDTTADALAGTTDASTGLPYPGDSDDPWLAARNRADSHLRAMAVRGNDFRVYPIKDNADALGVRAGRFAFGSTVLVYAGEDPDANVGLDGLTDNDTTYVWLYSVAGVATIGTGIASGGWPSVPHVKLAEVTMVAGVITLILDRRGEGLSDTLLPVYIDATRPVATTAGRMIFNSDDGNLNIDTGSGWILPDGTAT